MIMGGPRTPVEAIQQAVEAAEFPAMRAEPVQRIIDALAERGYAVTPVRGYQPSVGEPDLESGLNLLFSLDQITHHTRAAKVALRDEREGALRAAVSELHDLVHHTYRMVVNW